MVGHTNDEGDTLLHGCAHSLDQLDETSGILDPLLVQIMKNLRDMGVESTPNSMGDGPRDMFLAAGIKARELNEVLPEKKSTPTSEFSFKATSASAPMLGDVQTFGSLDGRRVCYRERIPETKLLQSC